MRVTGKAARVRRVTACVCVTALCTGVGHGRALRRGGGGDGDAGGGAGAGGGVVPGGGGGDGGVRRGERAGGRAAAGTGVARDHDRPYADAAARVHGRGGGVGAGAVPGRRVSDTLRLALSADPDSFLADATARGARRAGREQHDHRADRHPHRTGGLRARRDRTVAATRRRPGRRGGGQVPRPGTARLGERPAGQLKARERRGWHGWRSEAAYRAQSTGLPQSRRKAWHECNAPHLLPGARRSRSPPGRSARPYVWGADGPGGRTTARG